MNDNEFLAYVRECTRQGLEHRQIATKLGMDISSFELALRNVMEGIEREQAVERKLQEEKRKVEVVKPASGADSYGTKHPGVTYLE